MGTYHISLLLKFSAIIFCSFDDDYCNWNRQPNKQNDTTYGWGRHNSKQLDTDGIPGPPSDANDNRDKTFIIASNMISIDAPADANAKILSPYLLGNQHREECLSFMFYFSVKININPIWLIIKHFF